MKKCKISTLLLLLMMVCCLGGVNLQVKAENSNSYNLIQTVSAKTVQPGKWVKSAKGYRYRYTNTKKYPKNTWIKVKGQIFFVDKKGFRVSGFKQYKKNRYYLDKKGRLVTGWQEIDGNRYYASKTSGELYVGWNKIGNKEYYFNTKGILQANQWIANDYVGLKGYRQEGKRIFIGDSRTVGIQQSVGSEDVYIAKWGEGYNWFMMTAKGQLQTLLKKNPYSAVIFNLGVNDMANLEQYIQIYQSFRQQYPRARFYFLSVNPVEETFLRANGFNGRSNAEIESFNERMKEVFGAYYIDSYHWMYERNYIVDLPNGCGTVDGLHYIDAVYQMLYDFVVQRAV